MVKSGHAHSWGRKIYKNDVNFIIADHFEMFIIKLLITDSIEIDMNEQIISIFDGINLTTLIDNQNNVMGDNSDWQPEQWHGR